MRDPNRIPRILNLLEEYWTENPDLRLGQIVSNLTPDNYKRETADGFSVRDPFHMEDDVFEAALHDELT